MNWKLMAHLWWLRRSQWWAPARLRTHQERRLRSLVRHAQAHVPYYQRVFHGAGIAPGQVRTLDDLTMVPVLRRDDIVTHYDDLISADVRRYRPVPRRTSGTTGTRLDFLVDEASVNMGNAVLWRFRGWHGIRLRDRVAAIRNDARFRKPSGEIDPSLFKHFDRKANVLYLNPAIDTDPGRRRFIAEELLRFRPKGIIVGPPSRAALMCMYLLEHPEYRIQPQVAFTGGERVFDDQRRLIAEAFHTKVVEGYGNEEYVAFAGECEQGRLHVASEMAIVEILKNGVPRPHGEVGDIVVTNLWNRAFPFIRYAIGDMGYFETEPCPCGRGLPTWRVIGGRQKDLLATRQGFLWLRHSIVATEKWRGKISGIRFYQEARNAVVVQVVKGPGFVPQDEDALRADLAKGFGDVLDFSIEYYSSLEQTPGGKFRMVLSKVPLEF